MKKQTVAFCHRCNEKTKHNVLECKDNTATRIFETVFTLGFAALDKREYECECQKCGKIRTVNL